MAVDVVTRIDIARRRDEVAAFAADPSNATAWYKNIKAVEWETPPPLAVGSKLRFRARFLGRTLEYTYEVHEIDPGNRFVMTTAQGPFPMETTYSWRRGARDDKDDPPQSRRAVRLRCSHDAGHDARNAPGQRG